MWPKWATYVVSSRPQYWPKVRLLLGLWEFTLHRLYHRKFFHYYTRDVVDVVRGGADYDRLLPNVIDAIHFSSAAKLSKYLQNVAASKELYTRYLRNKDRHMVNRWTSYVASFCNSCGKLHNIESNRKSYNDHVTFWIKTTCVDFQVIWTVRVNLHKWRLCLCYNNLYCVIYSALYV